MSAVPAPKKQPAEVKATPEVASLPPETRRANQKTSDQTKYTDVKRTSSASFKPPMTKEQVKPQIQPPPKDSSWFAPFSYIKTMFGTKSVASAANTSVEKNNKSSSQQNTVKNTSNMKPDNSKYSKYTRDPDDKFGGDCKEGNFPSALMSNTDGNSPRTRPKSPSFSISPKDAVTKREPPMNTSTIFEMDEDLDPNAPKYKSIQNENQSTFLHAPDKKGTTSFRITTLPKVGVKQTPTVLSPSFSSSQQKKPMKMSRKGSTSPNKTRADSSSTRLRSKSTPDSSSMKPRPTYNFAKVYWVDEGSEPPRQSNQRSHNESIKHVSSWHSQQEHKRRATSHKDEKEPVKKNIKPKEEETSSPLSFLTKFMSPKANDEAYNEKGKTNKAEAKKAATNNRPIKNNSKKDPKEQIPAETKKDSSPARMALESAYEALSSKFSAITGTQETKPVQEENKPKNKTRPITSSPSRGRATRPNEKAKKETKPEEDKPDSPLQSTIELISSFVSETLTSKPDEENKSPTTGRGIPYKPTKNRVAKAVEANREDRSPIKELSNETLADGFHKRPGAPADYNLKPVKRRGPVAHITGSNSLTRANQRPMGNVETQHSQSQGYTNNKQEDGDLKSTADDANKDEMSISSAFQKFSSFVQSKVSPLVDSSTSDYENKSPTFKGKTATESVLSNNQTDSPGSEKYDNNHFYYLKKNNNKTPATSTPGVGTYMGNTKTARDTSAEPKGKVQSTFLKSHRGDRSPSSNRRMGYSSPSEVSIVLTPASPNQESRSYSPKYKAVTQGKTAKKGSKDKSVSPKKKMNPFKGASPRENSPSAPYRAFQGSALSTYKGGSPSSYR